MSTCVWVTGASRGIGRALAASVPWRDALVTGVSRSRPDDPPRLSGSVHYEHLIADLSGPEGWMAVTGSVRAALAEGGVDRAVMMHCAAAVGPIGFAGEVEPSEYQQSVVLNSVAPLVLGQGFIQALRDAPGDVEGMLMLMSSGSSGGVYEGWSSYKAGKAAVDEWVRITAAEEDRRSDGVRVLAVAPGVVATGMQEEIRGTADQDFPRVRKFIDLHEQGALADPEQVARRVWKLVTSEPRLGPVVDLRDLPTNT